MKEGIRLLRAFQRCQAAPGAQGWGGGGGRSSAAPPGASSALSPGRGAPQVELELPRGWEGETATPKVMVLVVTTATRCSPLTSSGKARELLKRSV